jgi:hypothetical protein
MDNLTDRFRRLIGNLLHLPARVMNILPILERIEQRLLVDSRSQEEWRANTQIKIEQLLNACNSLESRLSRLENLPCHREELSVLLGQLLTRQNAMLKEPSLGEVEFKVFSQFGDDGIIQYLVSRLDVQPRSFIELGVENYLESNTRFLLINNNWRGLVIDADTHNINAIKNQSVYWIHDLTAACAFVDAENVNQVIADNGFEGEIGLLSIDIDGNDYWVWRAINCISPLIVVCEFNAVLGDQAAVTVPYQPDFDRRKAHYSYLYAGASLNALRHLAASKGYTFAGCNTHGNNAYFVRNSHVGMIPDIIAKAEFVDSKFRESRDTNGQPSSVGGSARISIIKDMPVYDVHADRIVQIAELV